MSKYERSGAMSKTTKFEFSKIQTLLLVVTAITFIALVWKMILVNSALKVVFVVFLGGFVFLWFFHLLIIWATSMREYPQTWQ